MESKEARVHFVPAKYPEQRLFEFGEVKTVMNRPSIHESTKKHSSNCSELMSMAEPELAALYGAVRELFGSEQARLSAEDWLDAVAAINDLPGSTRQWRQITVKVLAQLAKRVNGFERSGGGVILSNILADTLA